MGASRLRIIKHGKIVDRKDIPLGIASDNINGPVVFMRPSFYPPGSRWIMYFAHHSGKAIRVAESDELTSDWVVSNKTVLDILKVPGWGHIASPEVVVFEDRLELFYHCDYADFQYTFKAITRDGENWEYFKQVQGHFYFRIIEQNYAIAKYKNQGGVWYCKDGDRFIEKGRLLPCMRHCCYCDSWLYWSEIGDMPEVIYRGRLNLDNFTISDKEKVIIPSESYEIANTLTVSKPGKAVGVTEVRDPFVVKYQDKTFIYYTVRGEEGIAVAEVL